MARGVLVRMPDSERAAKISKEDLDFIMKNLTAALLKKSQQMDTDKSK
jgi:hypothetical protein